MHRGQTIYLSLAGANHDPRANPDPETFDIERRDIRHQSFGGGRHLCLGSWLARLEAQEAILGCCGDSRTCRSTSRGSSIGPCRACVD